MLILATLLFLPQVQVTELESGETATELAPATAVSGDTSHANGRIVDALTGRPVHGASVQTWTEEINADFGGFHRIGQAASGLDGRFAVRAYPDTEKLLASDVAVSRRRDSAPS